MREFDEFEKRIIRKLKDFKERGVNLNFLSLLDDFFKDRGIELNKSSKEGWIYFDVRKFANYDKSINAWIPKGDLVPEVVPTTEVIIKLIFLLEYLKKNGLVFLYDFAQTDKDIVSFPEIKIPPDPIRLKISDKKVVELLANFFHKEVVISQSIITLANNNFLTKEEIQHSETIQYANRSLVTGERSIKVANRAIVVSIGLGLISILFSIYTISLTQKQIGKPIEFDNQQMDQLKGSIKSIDDKESLNRISNQLDSIGNELNSIKVSTKTIADKMNKRK